MLVSLLATNAMLLEAYKVAASVERSNVRKTFELSAYNCTLPAKAPTVTLLLLVMLVLLLATNAMLLEAYTLTLSVVRSSVTYILDESAYALKLPARAPISMLLLELMVVLLHAVTWTLLDAYTFRSSVVLSNKMDVLDVFAVRDTEPYAAFNATLLFAWRANVLLADSVNAFDAVKFMLPETALRNKLLAAVAEMLLLYASNTTDKSRLFAIISNE